MPPESSDTPPGPSAPVTPPPLPAGLLEPWRVIVVGAVGWLVATIAAFVIPELESWRPVSIAGLGTGVLGTTIFLWQRRAAQRGARGAQTGLTTT
ncbi:MAG: DUF2530 domain-containing protein [Mycobacterium sp.]|nr:DUF2530 domain-containing protein [Mycobacterium sp.]